MDNNELLQAMHAMILENNIALGQMMDERFEGERKHTALMMDEKLDVTKRELQKAINGLDMKLDNHFQKIQNLLQEDYGRIEGNAAKGAKAADGYEQVKGVQADHERAIQQHHERITALEEKAI